MKSFGFRCGYMAGNRSRFSKYYMTGGAIHSTKISGNFGPKLNGSVRSNRKSFEKTGPPFEVVLFSRSDRLEFWLNGSRPGSPVFSINFTNQSIKNSQAILKCFIDLKSCVWFTLVSEFRSTKYFWIA